MSDTHVIDLFEANRTDANGPEIEVDSASQVDPKEALRGGDKARSIFGYEFAINETAAVGA